MIRDAGHDKDGETYGPLEDFCDEDVFINYGVCHETRYIEDLRRDHVRIINDPEHTALSSDKVKTLAILKSAGVPALTFMTNKEQAKEFMSTYAMHPSRIYCRTLTRSKKGKGIVIASCQNELVDAPLYTVEFPKTHEYRVHVAGGNVIDWVQKKRCPRLSEDGEVNEDVRNRGRGWYFSHKNRRGHQKIRDIAVRAVEALGLDYAAVDMLAIWKPNAHGKMQLQDCVCCEINSAPGLTSRISLEAYIKYFNGITR